MAGSELLREGEVKKTGLKSRYRAICERRKGQKNVQKSARKVSCNFERGKVNE